MALSGMAYPLAMVSYNILKVRSDGRVIVRLELLKRIIMTAVLCYTIPRGVESVAWGMTAMAFVELFINTAMALRYLSVGVVGLLVNILPQLVLAATMFVALYLAEPYIATLTPGLRLLVEVTAGVAIYASGAYIFRLRAMNEALALLRGYISKSA